MELKFDLFDSVAAAIMTKEPLIIVEGKDDYQLYSLIANSIDKKIQVYQVNEFADYSEGCTGVIKAVTKLQPKFEERMEVIHKVLGIIDRDVKYFRGELPVSLKGLFVTKYYSIETYFATRTNLLKVINKISFTTSSDISEDVLTFVETGFLETIDDFYLVSLEALKNACTRGYVSVVGYDDSEGKITERGSRAHLLSLLESKKADLLAFAQHLRIDQTQIKLVSKGKWYLYAFSYYTLGRIKELKEKCFRNEITQCRSCKVGNYADCLYKLKQNYYPDYLRNELSYIIDHAECKDIIDALSILN